MSTQSQHDPLVDGDYYNSAYGPSILLTLRSAEATRWLRATFDNLASGAIGDAFRLDAQPVVTMREPIAELALLLVGQVPAKHLVKTREGVFAWSCTADEWSRLSLLIEPLEHQSGHQYLTSEMDDDALIEVSFGEDHGP